MYTQHNTKHYCTRILLCAKCSKKCPLTSSNQKLSRETANTETTHLNLIHLLPYPKDDTFAADLDRTKNTFRDSDPFASIAPADQEETDRPVYSVGFMTVVELHCPEPECKHVRTQPKARRRMFSHSIGLGRFAFECRHDNRAAHSSNQVHQLIT